MKGELFYLYFLLRWLILTVLTLSIGILFIIEEPSIVLNLIANPLKKEGISYKSIEGGILSGFTLKGFNYKNKIEANEVKLKIDWEKLKNRVLYIDNLVLNNIYIEKNYLASIINNKSNKNSESEDNNNSLPFDKIIINNSNITLKNIIYSDYNIKHASIEIKNFTTNMIKEYKGDIKLTLDSNITKANLNASVDNNFVKLSGNIKLNKKFIAPYLIDSNITLLNNPEFIINASGNIKKVKYHIINNYLAIKKGQYSINSKKLILKGNYIDKRYIDFKIDTLLDGNIGNLKLNAISSFDLNDLNKTLKYNATVDSSLNKKFLSYLIDKDIIFERNPNLKLKAIGSMRDVKYDLAINSLKVKYNIYKINSKKLIAKGVYNIDKNYLDNKLNTIIDSNLAYLKLNGNTALNLNDINRTLNFKIYANLLPNKKFLESKLNEENISIENISTINLNLDGNLKKTIFSINSKNLKVKKDNIKLNILSSIVKGDSNILKGDTNLNLITSFNSTIANGNIESKTKLNFYDLNHTLNYNAKMQLDAKTKYLNNLLKDENITIINSPKMNIKLNGGIEKITFKTHANMSFLKNKKRSNMNLKTTPITVNIKRHHIDGSLTLINKSKNMGFSLNSKFNGDYTKPKELKTSTRVSIKNFNDFGINLNPLTPLNLKILNSKNGAYLKLNSKRVNINMKTKDYDYITFNIKTRNLYLYKIIKLPVELYHKFIKLNLKGDAVISKKYFNINGYIYSNKKFEAKIDAKNNKYGLNAKIETKYLKIITKGNIDKKDINIDIKTDSIANLQKEINKIYPFTIAKVDGAIDTKIKIKDRDAWLNIFSSKIELNGFNIEDIDIDAKYNKDLITINRFNLKTTGFKDKKLNKKIHLNRKGKIYIGEKRDILIDMLPNILVVAKGNKENFNGRLVIRKLPLGHPDYGSMFLNSNINYNQIGDKKRITGNIDIKKMKLFYEAKFLDVDYDPDVVIVTKKSKKLKERLDSDSFLKNTYINIKVKAKQANYKTPDIDLTFDVKLDVNKGFGKPIALIGRVEDINGWFDQVPKRFNIKNSTIVFDGGEDINPLLDINVEYELPQVLIQISIGGYAKRPKIEFTSEPPMPKKDIMSYLLLGVSTANLTNGQGSLGREAELFILNQAARDFAYDFDLDRLFIKDDGTGDGYIVEVGKKVTKRDMVILESSPTGNSYILEHDFSKNIKLRVGQHQKEHPSQSIDLFFRKKFK